VANEVTFVEAAGDGGDSSFGGEDSSASKSSDVVVEDVSDEEIDLDSIPF